MKTSILRSAALDGEKWDPLKLPQTSTYAEDRAKLVKSKKLGPLMRNYKGDVPVLECSHCTAFFTDKHDFEKHRLSHGDDVEPDVRSDVFENSTTKVRKKKSSPTFERTSPRWRNTRQKLRIKLGGNVAKKTTKNAGKKNESFGEEVSAEEATSRRRSARVVSYTEFDDSDMENRSAKRRVSDSDEYEVEPVTKRRKDNKGRRYSGLSDPEEGSSNDEKLLDQSSEYEIIEEMILEEKVTKKKNDENVKRRKPRLKRLRRSTGEDDEDKGQTIYTCAHCLRNFRRKSNLKRHMSKLHLGKEKDEAGDSSKWFTGYCCDICGEGLQVRSMMMAHRDVVHGKYPEIDWCKYQTSLARVKFCNECKKYFRAGKLYDEHKCDKGKSIEDEDGVKLMKEAEEVKPSFVCHICNLCFRWKWDYRLHRETEHKDVPPMDWVALQAVKLEFFCEKCFKAYTDEEALREHECSAAPQQSATDTVVKPFRCDLCGNDYFWKSDFRRHMRTKHPKENYRPTEHDTIIYSCPYCEEKFSMKKRILYHMRKAHNITSDSPFVCVQCNKVFRRRDNLDRHNESYHPTMNDEGEAKKILSDAEIKINGETAYHCQMCNRNITNPNRFISHYRGHYSENKFTCDLCGKQAKTQHQLNTHIKNIHLNIRNYKCDLCDKSFYTKQACEEHRRIHTGERPFSCEICGKTFVAGNALISHKRFHNDFYPHSCHMCPKKFKVRRSLINHIRTHTGERPFKCDLCTKTFNNSSQYSYHKKVTHSEARPFSCSICGNSFKANKFLTRHLELHTVRSQIQSRKPNNPSHYVTSPMKSTPPVTSTNMVTHQRISHAEQVGLAQIVAAVPPQQPPQSQQPVSTAAVYVKETQTSYRSDDLVAAALYNLQRGYEPNGTEFARTNECDISAMNTVKRNFTAADAYMAAANYALNTNDDYNKTNVNRTYPNAQPPGNHPIATGKHMTWL